MSTARFAIDRIAVTLQGISPAEAERTARSLEAALVERLGGWRPDIAGASPMHLGDADLGSIKLATRLDAQMLATIVADRLTAWIDGAIVRPEEKA
jgi:hypothetical protein